MVVGGMGGIGDRGLVVFFDGINRMVRMVAGFIGDVWDT